MKFNPKSIITLSLFIFIELTSFAQIKREVFYDRNKTQLQEIYYVSKEPPYLKNGSYKGYTSNGTLIKEANYKNGKLNGSYKEMYNDGTSKVIAVYKDNLLNGVYKSFFGDGKPKIEAFHVDGVINGRYNEYNENGNKKIQTTVKNGKEDGLTVLYNENGTIKSERQFSEGVYNGYDREYYANGKLHFEAYAKMGKKDGPFKQYYESGKIEVEGTMVNDKQEGIFKTYTEAGDFFASAMFQDNEQNGTETLYTKNKGIIVTNEYKDGKLIANGKVTFNGSINGIEEYKNAFHGTEYGIETEWIPFAQGKYQYSYYGKTLGEQHTINLFVKVIKRFSKPDVIYIQFDNQKNRDFPFYNLILEVNKATVFNDYYNFGITKYGRSYNPAQFLNFDCKNPLIQISLEVENPNPQYDEDDNIPLSSRPNKLRLGNSQESAIFNERNMQKMSGGGSPPNSVVLTPSCNAVVNFQNLVILAGIN